MLEQSQVLMTVAEAAVVNSDRGSVGKDTEAARSRLDELGDVLLLAEAAAVLRTSVRTIKRSLRAGTFPIRTLRGIDKRIRFAKIDVERFLHRQQVSRRGVFSNPESVKTDVSSQ